MFARKVILFLIYLILPVLCWSVFPVQAWSSNTSVDVVDYPISVQKIANDPLFFQQSNLIQIRAPQAWEITTGDNIIIALIDTGVAIYHEDLMGRFWSNPREIPNNQRDDDGNGYVDDIHGYNFYQNNNDISDNNGHGTSIASVIAAHTNNLRGMAGINWNARIMVLKALNNLGGGEYRHVAQAIRYAVDNGAKVINMSFGTYLDNIELKQAVDYAVSRNVVVVAAAGNNGRNELLYPAAYSNVIAVGAVDDSDQRVSFSNYGAELNVMAPGLNVLAANYERNDAYASNSGTSYAAAHVAGLVSLVLSHYSGFTPQQVKVVIEGSAKSTGSALEYGSGLIDMAAALSTAYQSNVLSAHIYASANTLPADGSRSTTVTIILKKGELLEGGRFIRARVTGGSIKINDSIVQNGEIDLGATNTQGVISFEVSSQFSGTKELLFIDSASGSELGSIQIVFDPVGPIYYQAAWVSQSPSISLALGSKATLWVELENTSNVPWQGSNNNDRGQFRLGTYRPADRSSIFYHSSWLSSNRVATLNQSIVNPGEIGRISFTIEADRPGVYREYFSPVVEYITWLTDLSIYWDITVTSSQGDVSATHYKAQLIDRSPDLELVPNEDAFVSVTFRNNGVAAWSNEEKSPYGAVKLGTAYPHDRQSIFYIYSWLSDNRAIGTGSLISSGGQLMLNFNIKAPATPGIYYESFRLVSEYVTWFGPVVTWKIKVS